MTSKPLHVLMSQQIRERRLVTTLWLGLIILTNAYVFITDLMNIFQSVTIPIISLFLVIVEHALVIGGAVLLLCWKKIGFYLIIAGQGIAVLVIWLLAGNILLPIVQGAFGLIILYNLLQIPTDNEAWRHLT